MCADHQNRTTCWCPSRSYRISISPPSFVPLPQFLDLDLDLDLDLTGQAHPPEITITTKIKIKKR
jgi:hypothetical protein